MFLLRFAKGGRRSSGSYRASLGLNALPRQWQRQVFPSPAQLVQRLPDRGGLAGISAAAGPRRRSMERRAVGVTAHFECRI